MQPELMLILMAQAEMLLCTQPRMTALLSLCRFEHSLRGPTAHAHQLRRTQWSPITAKPERAQHSFNSRGRLQYPDRCCAHTCHLLRLQKDSASVHHVVVLQNLESSRHTAML